MMEAYRWRDGNFNVTPYWQQISVDLGDSWSQTTVMSHFIDFHM